MGVLYQLVIDIDTLLVLGLALQPSAQRSCHRFMLSPKRVKGENPGPVPSAPFHITDLERSHLSLETMS